LPHLKIKLVVISQFIYKKSAKQASSYDVYARISSLKGSVMFSILFSKKWKDSNPHLLLLSKFKNGLNIHSFSDLNIHSNEQWKLVLGEAPVKAIKRMVKESALVPADESVSMLAIYSASELKSLCTKYQLPVSGTKPKLAARVIEAQPAVVKQIVSKAGVYSFSQEGKSIANAYIEKSRIKLETAEKECFDFLAQHKYEAAVRTMVAFEKDQVFDRGMGIDWRNYDISSSVYEMKILMEDTPKMLKEVPKNELDKIRVPTALRRLFGTSINKKSLPDDINTGIHLNAVLVSMMLTSYVSFKRTMQGAANMRGITVRYSLPSGRECCDACKRMADKTYPLSKAPEAPFEDCKCPDGCSAIALLDMSSA